MQVIRDLASAAQIDDLEIRHLIEQHIHDLSQDEPYDPDLHGYFIVVEPGDRLDALNHQIGFSILANRFDGTHFCDPDFTPSFEILEEHGTCYEMVFIISDDGFGVEVFIPKTGGVDPDLLAMCARYATPATQEVQEP